MSPWRRSRRQFHGPRQIPFPIRSPASRCPLGGTGDTARAAEGHSHQPGRCQPGSRAGAGPPHLGRGPARPSDPSVSPSTVRTIRGTSGRAGAARRPRRPGWADAGAEARGDSTHSLRAEGSTAVRPAGFWRRTAPDTVRFHHERHFGRVPPLLTHEPLRPDFSPAISFRSTSTTPTPRRASW